SMCMPAQTGAPNRTSRCKKPSGRSWPRMAARWRTACVTDSCNRFVLSRRALTGPPNFCVEALELRQRTPPVRLRRPLDLCRHALGRVRAQRSAASFLKLDPDLQIDFEHAGTDRPPGLSINAGVLGSRFVAVVCDDERARQARIERGFAGGDRVLPHAAGLAAPVWIRAFPTASALASSLAHPRDPQPRRDWQHDIGFLRDFKARPCHSRLPRVHRADFPDALRCRTRAASAE